MKALVGGRVAERVPQPDGPGPAVHAPRPTPVRPGRSLLRAAALLALVVLLVGELVMGRQSLLAALAHLRAPDPAWLAAAVLVEVGAVSCYGRMQRHLLRSAGVRVSTRRHVALAYAAHSLSVTLPGGPAFSTRFNFQQMRRFGASTAVASWCIALSGILSAAALAVVAAGGAVAGDGRPQWASLAGLAVGVVLVGAGVRHLARRPAAVLAATRAVLRPVNRIRRRPATDGLDHITGFLQQLRSARLKPGHGIAAITFALLNWILDADCLWMCFRAVGNADVGLTPVLLAFCAAMAAGTITIVPGGLGIIDSALVLGLVAGGITTGTAIATVVLYRFISLGLIISMGWVSWLLIRRSA
jgi:hypothetical protein